MLHIVQHPKTKKYEVVSVAKNGEMLSISNQGFETKQGCYKHIAAQLENFTSDSLYFQDDTFVNPVVYYKYKTERPFRTRSIQPKPEPKYIMASRKKKAI